MREIKEIILKLYIFTHKFVLFCYVRSMDSSVTGYHCKSSHKNLKQWLLVTLEVSVDVLNVT